MYPAWFCYIYFSPLPPRKEMATYSSVLAWKIPWTGEPSGLQFMGSQRVRVRNDWATEHTLPLIFEEKRPRAVDTVGCESLS